MALSRAVSQLPHMTSRYERVLPDLEEVADIERDWKGLEFDPAAVARFQLNWIITARTRSRPTMPSEAVSEMAEEYGLRYGMQAGFMQSAAARPGRGVPNDARRGMRLRTGSTSRSC